MISHCFLIFKFRTCIHIPWQINQIPSHMVFRAFRIALDCWIQYNICFDYQFMRLQVERGNHVIIECVAWRKNVCVQRGRLKDLKKYTIHITMMSHFKLDVWYAEVFSSVHDWAAVHVSVWSIHSSYPSFLHFALDFLTHSY